MNAKSYDVLLCITYFLQCEFTDFAETDTLTLFFELYKENVFQPDGKDHSLTVYRSIVCLYLVGLLISGIQVGMHAHMHKQGYYFGMGGI